MRNRIALHAEPRKTIIASLAFTLISFFLMLILILSVNKDAIQLNSLLQSDYDYSVTMQDTVRKDDYYQFNAGIEFTLSADANTSLNANIVMQSKDSLYTDMVSWNAEPLSTNGVAVSENVAKSNNLHIGDKLYSKHIVNGESCEYVIEQLLPEAVSVRVTNDMNHSDGIIIMGYDERYIENITHSNIVFTKESINAAMKAVANDSYGYTDELLVSSDVIGMTYGSLFDSTQTMVTKIEDGLYQVQVVSWYDNENSYTSQMVRTIKYFAELG